MSINIDFSQTEEPVQVDPGMYNAQLIDMFEGITKTNKDKITMVFGLLDEGYEGRKIYADFVLSPKALPYLRRALVALGVPIENMRDMTALNVEEMRGLLCRIVVENTFSDTGIYTKVKHVLPPPEAQDEPDAASYNLDDLM
jgi:hypothetical protein